MKASTQLIVYGVFAFFAYRLIKPKSYSDDGSETPTPTQPEDPTQPPHTTPRPNAQWTNVYSTDASPNVVWRYEAPYQWTERGTVTSWETHYVVGNESHTSFVSSSAARTTIRINGATAETFFSEAAAVDYVNRTAQAPTGGPSYLPPEPASPKPSWQPTVSTGFGSSMKPPSQGW
ncbi:MAG: hypothetical protein CMI60_06765 [Parvibaculum sp.]|nr:hypothetical protein [Parvibaculum sp.]